VIGSLRSHSQRQFLPQRAHKTQKRRSSRSLSEKTHVNGVRKQEI
jgi:hypothetical protein